MSGRTGIPPPFRGVSSFGIRTTSDRRLYQRPCARTSLPGDVAPPRFASVPWCPPEWPTVVRERDRAAWSFEVTVDDFVSGPRFLTPLSPLIPPEEHAVYERPTPTRAPLGVLEIDGDTLAFTPTAGAPRCAIDGRWVSGRTLLRHGSVFDVQGRFGPPKTFQCLTKWSVPATLPTDAVVATAREEGAFVVTSSGCATLSPGQCSLRLDSCAWLERILWSPLQHQLQRLELDLWHPDVAVDWSRFHDAHRALARLAPFEVVLREPPRRRWAGSSHASAPHALFPADGWRQVALSHEDGSWVLRHRGDLARFVERGELLHEVQPDGGERPTPWFTAVSGGKARWPRTLAGFLLMPRPSAFLARARLPPAGPLQLERLSVFADQLIDDADAAGPLLARACVGDEEALRSLWQPYVNDGRSLLRGLHVAGFFEELELRPWLRFERDLPVLARHPMLQRLRVMRLDDRESIGPRLDARLLDLERTMAALALPFTIELNGTPVG